MVFYRWEEEVEGKLKKNTFIEPLPINPAMLKFLYFAIYNSYTEFAV